MIVNVNGIEFDLNQNEIIQSQMIAGLWEPTQTQWVKNTVCDGDVFIDLGANFGWFTSLASNLVGETGRVFAFEPSPVAFETLNKAMKNAKNVSVINAAAGKENTIALLHLPISQNVHSPSILHGGDPGFTTVAVDVVALDSFADISSCKKIKAVKLDIEGYEPDAISGMSSILSSGAVEHIFCELNDAWLSLNNSSSQKLRKQIIDLGFRVNEEAQLLTTPAPWDGKVYSLQDVWFTRS